MKGNAVRYGGPVFSPSFFFLEAPGGSCYRLTTTLHRSDEPPVVTLSDIHTPRQSGFLKPVGMFSGSHVFGCVIYLASRKGIDPDADSTAVVE